MENNREAIIQFILAINRLDGFYYTVATRLGLHENEVALLYALSDGKRHTQWEICRQWFIPRTTVNSITQKYVRLGYLELAPTGHREKELRLTTAGESFLTEVFAEVFQAEQTAFAQTIGENAGPISQTILQFIQKMEALLDGAPEGERP